MRAIIKMTYTDKKQYILAIAVMVVLFSSCREDIDPSIANTPFGMLSLIMEFITVFAIIIGGYVLIIAGVVVMLLGLNGNIEWVMEAAGFTSRLANASPGIVMIIAGTYLVSTGKIDVKAKKDQESDTTTK